MWECIFNLQVIDIPNETTLLFSQLKFDGEGKKSANELLSKFWSKCIKHKVVDLNVLCWLFASTFRGRIQYWLETLPPYSIYSWFEFVDKFLDDFEIYNFNKLCEKLEVPFTDKDLSLEQCSIKISHILCKFHLDDLPLVIDLIANACFPLDQHNLIADDNLETYQSINLHDDFCLQSKVDASVIEISDCKISIKQVEEEGQFEYKSINIDDQTNPSSEQSDFQSSSILV